MIGEILLLLDLLCLFAAAWISTALCVRCSAMLHLTAGVGNDPAGAVMVAMVLAPFILYDKRFGAAASRGQMLALVRSHAVRVTLFAGVVLALGTASHALDAAPRAWLVLWFAGGLASTSLTRVGVARQVRHLQRRGGLAEAIAVVGAGPVADRLMHALRQTRSESIELLGIFDDRARRRDQGSLKPIGTVAQLIELGKTRRIDWIVLTLPPTAEQRLHSTMQRLKALSAPIALCPQHVGLAAFHPADHYVGDAVPVSLLADRPIKRWDAVIKTVEDSLPRWITTLAMLPLLAIKAVSDRLSALVPAALPRSSGKSTLQFDDYDLAAFINVAAGFGQDRYGYAVTPNADHIIRLHEDASFRALYASASYILLDSRFLSKVLSFTRGIRLPVCTGSDLTERLFGGVIGPDDALVLIGGSDEQAQRLRERYGLRHLSHFNPPMGFVHDAVAFKACLRFIESHSPFRFCLLAVGAPQQEAVAQHLKSRGIARGLALCIGAAVNFLTGEERRAPLWMQRHGIEWIFRLLQAPGRMGHRYLVRGRRVFGILSRASIVLRPVTLPI